MAKKEAAAATGQDDAAAKGSKKKLLLIIGGAVAMLVLGVVLALVLLGGKDEDEESEEAEAAVLPAFYVALGEKFVVTLPAAEGQGKPHYLQVAISALTRDKAVIEELEFNAPLLRDRLNSLLARQDFERLRTEEGKLALRAEVLSTVQGIVDNQIADGGKHDEEEEEKPAKKKKKGSKAAAEEKAPGVEQIFFTEFVLQ